MAKKKEKYPRVTVRMHSPTLAALEAEASESGHKLTTHIKRILADHIRAKSKNRTPIALSRA